MRVGYKPLDERAFLERLKYDVDDSLTMGNGLGDINIFRKHKLHRGTGLFSDIVLKYGKKILPYLQKYLWPAAKQFGQNVARDVMSGDETLKKSLKRRGKQSLANIGSKILSGEGKRSRKLLKRRAKTKLQKRKKKTKAGRKKNTRRKRKSKHTKSKAHNLGGKRLKRKRKTNKTYRKKVRKSSSIRKLDCSRPSMKKMCHKDIFSM